MNVSAHIHQPASQISAVKRDVVLSVHELSKRYGENVALAPVSLDFTAGEVHVLFGENGAGKSTLISMLAGANSPSGGTIEMGNLSGRFNSVGEARSYGVRAVFQEFSLIPHQSVAENIILGEEPVNSYGFLDKRSAICEVQALIDDLGFELDAHAKVASLTRGKQQMVEICKALRRRPKLLILDEPTASLSEHDSQALLELVLRLRDEGTSVIYVTHRMQEIPVVGDYITILRDGQFIDTVPADTDEDELIRLMTGRELSKIYPQPRADIGNVRLKLDNITTRRIPGHIQVHQASLSVRAGEIVGIAGLVGCGKSELAQACFGLHYLEEGTITVDGRSGRASHPSVAIANKLWYSPSDRRVDGLAMGRSCRENMSLSSYLFGPLRGGWVKRSAERELLTELSGRVDFDQRKLEDPVSNLSGGNQQKVLLTKAMAQDISVFVFDEPTVGVDVGACLSIYKALSDLSAKGAAILIASSNLTELMGLTHRMKIMSNGRFVAEFKREDYDEHKILEQFF